jgi:hypothetical protein
MRAFLSYFPYFEEINAGLWDHITVCIYPPPINLLMAEPVFMKLGTYIMAPEAILTA